MTDTPQSAPPLDEAIQAAMQQAVTHHQAGQLQEAGNLYRAILQIQQNHADANHNLGVLLIKMLQPAAGLPHLEAALTANPEVEQYWLSYIDALILADQPDIAQQVLAMGRQHGLQGKAADVLAGRLEGDTQARERSATEDQHGLEKSLPASPATPRRKKPAKPNKSAKSPLPHHEPSPQEIKRLMSVLTKGRYTEATNLAQEMTERFPLHGFGWMILGLIFKRAEKIEEALAAMQKAAALSPGNIDAHTNLGIILQDTGRLDEAEASYRRALQIKPNYAEALNNLGNTLKELGRFSEAEASILRALEIKPDYANALVAAGRIAADRGQFAEAKTFFRRALVNKPEIPDAWAGIAAMRKMTPDDADWLATVEQIVQKDLTPRQESKLRHAMGKYYDDVKDYDQAFQNYRRANELKKSFCKTYDRQNWTVAVNQLIQFYHHKRVCHALEGASNSARPLFIVGMPRSGTSLTEQIVASHPSVFGAGELHFWNNAAHEHEPALLGGDLNGSLLSVLADECLRNLSGFSADALRVVDKMPVNFSHLGLIHAVFPNARILHTQRNPIDTCLSIYFQNFKEGHTYANDLDDLAYYYKEYHRLMAHWRTVLPPEVFLDVPYETLLGDQEGWSRKIIEFIGLDWDERCLDFHQTERNVGTASNWQVRQKIYQSSKERWRNYEKHVSPLLELLELKS